MPIRSSSWKRRISEARGAQPGRDIISRNVARRAVVVFIAAISLSAGGQAPDPLAKPTPDEWRLLPIYCPDTQGFKYGAHQGPNAEKWVAMMGETFWALHHYC